MTKVTIKLDPKLDAILEAQQDIQSIEHERAQQALAIAQSIAPKRTGEYVDSLAVDGNQLLTDDPMGHLVEWGSINNRAYAVLRQASEQVARVVEDPK